MDDRIPLRIGALRLARRRGRTSDGAWAASRLRLEGVRLAPSEARFARSMRVKFGRALRTARLRRGQPTGARTPLELVVVEPRSRRRELIAAALGAAILLGALFLFFRGSYEEGGNPEGAPAAQAVVVVTPSPVRGRTEPGVKPVAVVVATPAPTEGPAASTEPSTGGTGNAGTGTGAGGSGGGNGTGNAPRTTAPTTRPTTTPAPTVAPTPTPAPTVAATLVHVRGQVVHTDPTSGADLPLPGACISYGSLDCSLVSTPHTDANGNFDFVLDAGSSSRWSLRFEKFGYATNSMTITLVLPSPGYQYIGTIRLRPQ